MSDRLMVDEEVMASQAAEITRLQAELATAREARDRAIREANGAIAERTRLFLDLSHANSRLGIILGALGLDTPSPVFDVLDRLAAAAQHLLRDHDCDLHGWEGVDRSAKTAIEQAVALRTALSETAVPKIDNRIFWSVSSDEERFTGDFTTKEEAIAAAPAELGLEPGDRFWIGKGSHYTIGSVDLDSMFERLVDDAGEECGEVAEDWHPAPDEICEAEVLAAVLRCLVRTKDMPGFWTVNEIEEHRAPEETKP